MLGYRLTRNIIFFHEVSERVVIKIPLLFSFLLQYIEKDIYEREGVSMITVSKSSMLILTCITFLPRTYAADCSLKAASLCAAFSVILPATLGLGIRCLEKQYTLDIDSKAWSAEHQLYLETSKVVNTLMISGISLLTWFSLKGTVSGDIGVSCALLSAYTYAHGRAYYMERQSKLQQATSFLLPAAIGMLVYTRISELTPHLDVAGKFILVLGLAHYGA